MDYPHFAALVEQRGSDWEIYNAIILLFKTRYLARYWQRYITAAYQSGRIRQTSRTPPLRLYCGPRACCQIPSVPGAQQQLRTPLSIKLEIDKVINALRLPDKRGTLWTKPVTLTLKRQLLIG